MPVSGSTTVVAAFDRWFFRVIFEDEKDGEHTKLIEMPRNAKVSAKQIDSK